MLFLLSLLSYFIPNTTRTNACTSFQVAPGTGCQWMCNYCAAEFGANYYFTTDVCKYQAGGCVGNPLPGVQYTCCAGNEYHEE